MLIMNMHICETQEEKKICTLFDRYPLFQNVISPSYDFKLTCDFQYSTSLILFINSLSFNHMSKAPRHLMLHFTILYTWRLTSNISEGLYLISQLIAFLNISG